jgi:hypothetical protein
VSCASYQCVCLTLEKGEELGRRTALIGSLTFLDGNCDVFVYVPDHGLNTIAFFHYRISCHSAAIVQFSRSRVGYATGIVLFIRECSSLVNIESVDSINLSCFFSVHVPVT